MPHPAQDPSNQDVEDNGDSGFDEDYPEEAKGRKKGSNSQATRRDQNRIAQRDFRLRKQQKIRDLERKVEILAANREDSLKTLDGMMQDLIRENQALRQLVRDLSGFIGDGIGGFLPKLGWDIQNFEDFKSKGELDTMGESYAWRKKNPNTPAPIVPTLVGQKRRIEEPNEARKKAKGNDSEGLTLPPPGSFINTSLFTASSSASTSSNNATGAHFGTDYTPNASSTYNLANVPPPSGPAYSNTRTVLPPPLPQLNSSTSSGLSPYTGGGGGSTPSSINNPNSLNHNVGSATYSTYPTPSRPAPSDGSATPSIGTSNSHEDPHQAKREEIGRLIRHHMTSYERNPAYCLPASLRPTQIQRTVAHEYLIDGVLIPDVRDKMILYKGRFDLAGAMHLLISTCRIHTEDTMVHTNWEVSEEWLRQYGFLATAPVLETTNKWRRERGEPEIPLSVIEAD